MPAPDALLAALKAEGLTVIETDGWRTRGYDTLEPVGSIVHHTAGGTGPTTADDAEFMARGRADLAGPLCNGLIGKDGRVWLIAARRARHAGPGAALVLGEVRRDIAPSGDAAARGLPDDDTAHGNRNFYGWEIDHPGDTTPYPAVQIGAVVRVQAALCRLHGWTAQRLVHHREWTRRKIDMSYRGDLRRAVAARLEGTTDTVTADELKAAMRAVLNEATATGQRTWAGTVKATLGTVQTLVNRVAAVESGLRAVAADVAEIKAGSPAACSCTPERIAAAVDPVVAARFTKAGS